MKTLFAAAVAASALWGFAVPASGGISEAASAAEGCSLGGAHSGAPAAATPLDAGGVVQDGSAAGRFDEYLDLHLRATAPVGPATAGSGDAVAGHPGHVQP